MMRAKSGPPSNEYLTLVIRPLFIRDATSRYHETEAAMETDQATGRMPRHPLVKARFVKRRQSGVPPDEAITRIATTNSSIQVQL